MGPFWGVEKKGNCAPEGLQPGSVCGGGVPGCCQNFDCPFVLLTDVSSVTTNTVSVFERGCCVSLCYIDGGVLR